MRRLLLALLITLPLAAQQPLHFEVTSIHPNPPDLDRPSSRQVLPGGRFVATGTSARALLRIAFGTDDNRISVPAQTGSWLDNQTFDITATVAGHTDIATTEQFQQLLLSLLEDRFQLKFHREQKEGPIFRLELDKPGKLGPALHPSPPGAVPNMSNNSNGVKSVMKVTAMSMTDIAAGLRRQAGRPVEDHTSLSGLYDFQIEWSPEDAPDSTDPGLFTVLKEQLGLKLQPAKGPIEQLVIDQITQPTAN